MRPLCRARNAFFFFFFDEVFLWCGVVAVCDGVVLAPVGAVWAEPLDCALRKLSLAAVRSPWEIVT